MVSLRSAGMRNKGSFRTAGTNLVHYDYIMCALPLLLSATIVTNVSGLVSALRSNEADVRFSILGMVATEPTAVSRTFILVDDTNRAVVLNAGPDDELGSGDLIRVIGKTKTRDGYTTASSQCERLERLSHQQPPQPRPTSPSELKQGRLDDQFVSIRGTVSECFTDEIDPDYTYTILVCGSETIFVTARSCAIDSTRLLGLIGAEVSVRGIYSPLAGGARRMARRMLLSIHSEDAFTVHRKPPSDPFDMPSLDAAGIQNATDIITLGQRRITGRVLAVWRSNHFLLADSAGQLHKIKLNDTPPPQFGQTVDAVGHVETDLYTINLSHAVWRTTSASEMPAETPLPSTLRHLFVDGKNRNAINTQLFGKTIRLSGKVQDILPSSESGHTVLLQNDSHIIAVDISANRAKIPPIRIGSTIEVTGTYIVEAETWHPHAAFPRVTGVLLAVRKPDDVRILAQPPLLTPTRLLTAIGILLAVLFGILVWNLSLRRIAERRSHELLREEIAHIGSELRLDERTRLAVELHDSVLQNLTSVALQLDIAHRLSQTDAAAAEPHFDIVAKTLQSCHEELRNCVWDLRNQTLEEHDMESAIRRVLRPRIGTVQLSVRFNVPRERFSDNTAYALLHIIRELATNAVKHGKASTIKVAGAIERQNLLISVIDNGCGFDPQNHPGIADGHFGLQGIAERIRRLNGTLEIESTRGHGTRVRITLKTREPTEGEG